MHDNLPAESGLIMQAENILNRGKMAYHKCAYFVNRAAVDVAWKLRNFATMIVSQYFYCIEVWFAPKAYVDKLRSQYNKQLKMTLRVNRVTSSAICILLAGCKEYDWWQEYYRLKFKYDMLRRPVDGPQKWAQGWKNSITGYARWSSQESHNDILQLASAEIPEDEVIHEAMNVWRTALLSKMWSKTRIDGYVGQVIESMNWWIGVESPKLYEWLSNTELKLVLETLGNGNNFLDGSIICVKCGGSSRSWTHNCIECESISVKVDIERMFENKAKAKIEVSKLKELIDDMRIDVRQKEITGRTVRIMHKDDASVEGQSIKRLYVSKKYSNGLYRCTCMETGILMNIRLQDELFKGNVYLE